MPMTFQPAGDVGIVSEERVYVRNVHAPHAVRRFVRAILGAWGMDHLVDDSETVASELATNAVQNAAGDTVAVRIERSADGICLKVWDDNPEDPVMDSPGLDAERGRGLMITAAPVLPFRLLPGPGQRQSRLGPHRRPRLVNHVDASAVEGLS